MSPCNVTEHAFLPDTSRRLRCASGRSGRTVVFFAVVVLCMVLILVQASQDGQWAFWVSNFVFFGVLLNALVFLRSRRDICEPVVLVGAMFLSAFAARWLFLYFEVDLSHVNSWVLSNMHLLGRMSAYTVLGFTMFLLAYYCPVGAALARRLPRVKTTWNMDRLGAKAIRMYCVCLPAKLLGIVPAGSYPFQDVIMSYVGNLIGLLAALTDIALFLYGVYYYHHRSMGVTKGKRPFYAMIGIQLVAGFLTGYREPMFVTLIVLLFMRHYAWKPLKAWNVVISLLVAILCLTPVSRAYRNLVWVNRQDPLVAMANVPEEIERTGRGKSPDESFLAAYSMDSLLNISNRFHGADSLIACMATVPEYLEYQKGETLYLLPMTVFVPRAFWPEKPKIGLGTFFREHIWRGPWNESDSGGQIAITQVGELFVNFGLWGIVVGMLILGIFHRFMYSYLIDGHGRGNYGVLLFYFAAVLCFLAIERNFAFSYGYLLKLLVVLYFLCRYLNKGPVFTPSRARRRRPRVQVMVGTETRTLPEAASVTPGLNPLGRNAND